MLVTYSLEVPSLNQSQYTVVGIVTMVQAGWFRVWRGKIFFSLLENVHTRSGCSPCLLFNGYCGSFLGGKVAGLWCWPVTSIYSWQYLYSPLFFHVVDRDNLTLSYQFKSQWGHLWSWLVLFFPPPSQRQMPDSNFRWLWLRSSTLPYHHSTLYYN